MRRKASRKPPHPIVKKGGERNEVPKLPPPGYISVEA